MVDLIIEYVVKRMVLTLLVIMCITAAATFTATVSINAPITKECK